MSETLFKTSFAEFIGTFLLVFFGTGAIVVDDVYNGIVGHLGISVAFGLVVLIVIYAIGEISGAHLNPAVSLGFFAAKRMPFNKTVWYIIAQILGAILASMALKGLFPESMTLGETMPSGSIMQTIITEIILSFTLMFVIINVATGSKEQGITAGLAIGFTVLICALVGGPISGASMNPARSIGPAMVSFEIHHLWIYILAPIVGAILGVLVWKLIKSN
ncbi:MAG: MIP family channel protein [Bacteroidia bacterium]|nr:MIP family channel protein [Bacteroidia bacterium]MBT8311078.1 MIP family channel protein [Bacteroidia bacterium]NNL61129.1 MIP family channel protein [Flavobacteriaceae bacterium]